MSQLITHRRSVTNEPLALSASIASGVSAPLIEEPTPLTEATPTASQVLVSSTSSMSVQPHSARQPHRRRHEPEPFDHTSSASRVEGEASQPAEVSALKEEVTTRKGQLMDEQIRAQGEQIRTQGEEMKAYVGHVRDLVRAI
ncbi:hypothetical protein D8674_031441 [Pyrus ussuriensis x Pyrus communis]|uniref:Uncharacterized protein n=1 Tax=Pyrus ussuriensis x Pyrus communis TaxID=2448454 RepID=A0A5N5F1E7_9ROSA|nr:hypothetical protein D8674_031441 [Pyrus ussuriensis x Pyrus communis]